MFIPTIGLEIHAELKTKTKMFCSCLNEFEAEYPNTNICPICLGHPGTLPVVNKEAIDSVIKIGLALGGKISKNSRFDRKSYFYPDLPKGYQISQYELPLVEGGELANIKIRRIHIEEDTGSLLHTEDKENNYSLVDFNRSGLPLMELVTEPDINSSDEAVRFAKQLQLILRYLEISDADMEKGQMRIEVNISLKTERSKELGSKVEVKNINSFKSVYGAIEFEMERQRKILESGNQVSQETRGWNSEKGITETQRLKESAHDYRYFPEPDIPPLNLEIFDLEELKRSLPELPDEKIKRLENDFGLKKEEAEIVVESRDSADYFEKSAKELISLGGNKEDVKILYNYFSSDLRGIMADGKIDFKRLKMPPSSLAKITFLIKERKLSSRLAKDVLLRAFQGEKDPEQIIKEEKIEILSGEDQLAGMIEEVIEKNPKAISDYQKGQENAIEFLFGMVMKESRGSASPVILRRLLKERLDKLKA